MGNPEKEIKLSKQESGSEDNFDQNKNVAPFNEYGELLEEPEEEDTLEYWEWEKECIEEILKESREALQEVLEEIDAGEIFYDVQSKRFPETSAEKEEMKGKIIKNNKEAIELLTEKIKVAEKKIEEHKRNLEK